MKNAIIVFTMMFTLSCNSSKNQSEIQNSEISNESKVSAIDKRFDKSMAVLMKKYPRDNMFTPNDSVKYYQIFSLDRRLYIPEFKSLTFDKRDFNQVSHIYAHVIHIYNDTFDFVLPFTDMLYLKTQAASEKPIDVSKNLNFEIELNQLISKLGLNDRADVENLLDILMSFEKAEKIRSEIDYTVFNENAKYFLKTGGGEIRKACDSDLRASMKRIEQEYKDANSVIYTNHGVIDFIFSFQGPSRLKAEILNVSCND